MTDWHKAGKQTENNIYCIDLKKEEERVSNCCEGWPQGTDTSVEVSRMFIIFLQYKEIMRRGPCIHLHLAVTSLHEAGF